MSVATQEQAAAALQHYFDQRLADAMPAAFQRVLGSASVISAWLAAACTHSIYAKLGTLTAGAADVQLVGTFSPPTLLVLLMDRRQPVEIAVAARDALVLHFLEADHVKAQVKAEAEVMARRALQHLVQQRQAERAELQSLYGGEHQVTGLPPLDMAAVTAQAQADMAAAAGTERV